MSWTKSNAEGEGYILYKWTTNERWCISALFRCWWTPWEVSWWPTMAMLSSGKWVESKTFSKHENALF